MRRLPPGTVYLWLAVLIFGAANAVTRRISEIGAQHTIDGRNPVSLCNVLFVGNLCALLVLLLTEHRQLSSHTWQKYTRKEWLGLTLVAALAGAIAPGLIFTALATTTVNNVVLIGRLEPVLALLLSIWLLSERVNAWEIIGASLSFMGIGLTIALQPTSPEMVSMAGLKLGMGEFLTVIAAITLAVSTLIGKRWLSQVPIGFYGLFRTALGTLIFFLLALLLYGHHHFMDVFSPLLWKWMLIYGPVIVVLGQSFWIQGLRQTTVAQASLASSLTPIVGIFFAYFILGEAPTWAQYLGGSVILVGIGCGQIGLWRQQAATAQLGTTAMMQTIDNQTGFKGV